MHTQRMRRLWPRGSAVLLRKGDRSFLRCDGDWPGWVLSHTGSQALLKSTLLQNLWGGYGELLRLTLQGGSTPSVILKRVVPPSGLEESVSDRRKRRSYLVEQAWYADGAKRCDNDCRVATCYAIEQLEGSSLLLLEDLGNAGFAPERPPRPQHIRAGLSWLAHFHSRFLSSPPPGLWEQGSYWHLDTRREEWRGMPEGCLKTAAEGLDQRLKAARYQTLLHGDAKPANFCWSPEGSAAAVDFQYVGPGCGIRDVAYFLDCCLGETGCERQANDWLELYFDVLRQAMRRDGHADHAEELEKEWRALYPVAWSDFCRFYQGWGNSSPLGSYSQRQLRQAAEGKPDP